MVEARPAKRRSRVPSGRLERLLRMGWLAGELALGGSAERLRRLRGTRASDSLLLTGANGRRLARRLSTLRGTAMKLGQLLSLEAQDLLPPEVAEALSVLRASGDAMPREQLRRVLSRAWGRGWEARFRAFDFEPLASASIGQVHAATHADGRELALKIQYPGVARSIDSDVDNLAAVLRLARILPGDVDFSPILAEAKRQLRAEADYRNEAGHLRRYAALLADQSDVVVPRVHGDLTTARVLAMDRLRGLPLEDVSGAGHGDASRNRVCALLLRLALRELFEFRFMQTDPNFANYLLLPDERIGLLDLGAGYDVPEALSLGYAQLFRAAADGDRERLRRSAEEMGLLHASDAPAHVKGTLELVLLASEPFRQRGPYDFGHSDLPARARAASTALVFEHGFWRPPPPPVLFLQRKLGGTFLLCVRLRGRVDARALLEEALEHRRRLV